MASDAVSSPAADRLARAAAAAVVGRRREVETLAAALAAGRDVLLEGPPGTSKSTLLRALAAAAHAPLVMVEGNADLTPAKLTGWHDPAAVLAHGYRPEDFTAGPLVTAMRTGALLYIEELNRAPADTLNLLLGPLAERTLMVPRVGEVRAAPGFRLIAAMNPYDTTIGPGGTAQVSVSIHDRLCRLAVGYQSRDDEHAIVRLRSHATTPWLVGLAVDLTRATRTHPQVRMGASVRGAIDLVLVAERLAGLNRADLRHPHGPGGDDLRALSLPVKDVVLDAALVALTGRVVLDDAAGRTPESVVRELWEDLVLLAPQAAHGPNVLEGVDSAIELPTGRGRGRGPVELPRRAPSGVPRPRPGTVDQPARVYQPDELQLLTSERGAPNPAAVQQALRDHPAARNLLDADQLDVAAWRELYDRDPEAALAFLTDLGPIAPDPELRDLARRLALRIVLRLARRDPTTTPGKGTLRSVRYRFNSDDLDLDRTLEEIAGKPYPEYGDFWVRERVRARRTYLLLLDVSGSMRGVKLLNAALAVAALARNVDDGADFAVVLFWRDAAVAKRLGQVKPLTGLLDEILSVRARGLTNLHLGLETGLRELERAATTEQTAVLFSDSLHNLGEDPLPLAGKYPTLHVIGTAVEDAPVVACQELAAAGRGRCVFVRDPQDIPAALSRCLSG